MAPVQDAPSLGKLSGDGLFLGEIQEDTTQVFTEAELLEFYLDVDDDSLSIVAGSVSSPNGTVTINEDGNYVFTPTQHFFGATQISFTITDNAPGSPNEITVEKFLKVIAVNDAPLISLPIDVSSDYIDERSQAVADIFENAPTKQASFSVAAGFDRFFTLSDFGYSDQEVTTMHSVLIQVPDPSIGVFMLGPGNYVAEGVNVLADELLPDGSKISVDDTNFVRISYDDINDGKFFFASVPDAVGRISKFEFKVTDTLQSTRMMQARLNLILVLILLTLDYLSFR